MVLERRKHFAVESLSEEGQAIVCTGLEENRTLEEIVRELQEETGETISSSSLHRWLSWQRWTRRQGERQKAVDAALEMVKADPDGRFAQMMSLALQEYLIDKESELGEGSLDALLAKWSSMQKLQLAHKRTEIAERDVAAEEVKARAAMIAAEAAAKVAEAKLEALRQAAQKAAETLREVKGKVKDGKVPAEVLDRVLADIYGIERRAEQEAPDA